MATGKNCKISIGGQVIMPWVQYDYQWDMDVLCFGQQFDIPSCYDFLRFMDQITKLGLHK